MNTINITDTYSLLQAISRSYPPTTLMRDTFFPHPKTFVTKTVLMDYRKGTRRMSPFVAKGASGVVVGRSGFNTKEYEPPMMAPERPINIADIDKRGFGENVFSTRTPEQRATEIMAQDIADLIEMNTRRMEWMCCQLLLNGQFEAKGFADDGKEFIIDTVSYPDWTQKLTLTGGDKWDNAGADIYGNLQDMSQQISRNSGRVPNVAIGSFETCDKLLKNDSIMKYLMVPNLQNLSLMSFAPRIKSLGVRRMGYIQSLDLEIYAYDGVYEDDNRQLQQYLPDGYFIMGVSGQGSQLFGAVTQMESDGKYRTYEGANVPKVWNEMSKDVKMLRMASKGVPKPECIDDWYTLKAY